MKNVDVLESNIHRHKEKVSSVENNPPERSRGGKGPRSLTRECKMEKIRITTQYRKITGVSVPGGRSVISNQRELGWVLKLITKNNGEYQMGKIVRHTNKRTTRDYLFVGLYYYTDDN